MNTVHVVAAVICDSIERRRRIFATARGYGRFKGLWEFPGGKVEAGETSAEALKREIAEELGCTIRIGPVAGVVEYDYPDFHLSMECFFCEVTEGEIDLREAAEGRWLGKEDLLSVEWLPADIALVNDLACRMDV